MSDEIICIKKDIFDSVTLYQENLEELDLVIKSYLKSPKHLVINLCMSGDLSDEYLDRLNFLSTMLKSDNYSVELFSPNSKTSTKLGTHQFRNIPEISDLAQYVSKLVSIEKELRIHSLLKSYVDQLMKHTFSSSNIVLKRLELSIRDGGVQFENKMNYFQTFELEDSLFTFLISGNEEFFTDFLKVLNLKELSSFFNEIISHIPQELLENVKAHEFISHPYGSFPTEKIEIKQVMHDCFKGSSVMVIPFECNLGSFNLEIWIPKQFAASVYKFLNP